MVHRPPDVEDAGEDVGEAGEIHDIPLPRL